MIAHRGNDLFSCTFSLVAQGIFSSFALRSVTTFDEGLETVDEEFEAVKRKCAGGVKNDGAFIRSPYIEWLMCRQVIKYRCRILIRITASDRGSFLARHKNLHSQNAHVLL